MPVTLPVNPQSGLPLDPTTLQALQMQQMSQNIGMQGGSAATRLNESAFQQGLSNLFPSPAVQQSMKVQQALKDAQVTQQQGESQLDFSIRQLQAQRDAVAPYSPESAAALNTKITALANMKFEQSHIAAQDQREQGLADTEEANVNAGLPAKQAEGQFAAATGHYAYIGTKGQDGSYGFQPFDLTKPDQVQAMLAASQRTGSPPLSADRAEQLMQTTDMANFRARMAMAQAQMNAGIWTPQAIAMQAVNQIWNPNAPHYFGQQTGRIESQISQWYVDHNITPTDQASAKVEYHALQTAAATAARREGNMQTLENSITPLGKQVTDTLGGVTRFDFAPLNSAIRAGKAAFSDPGEAKYAAAVQSFVNEYGRVINGGTGVTSDAARNDAWSVLSKAQGPAGIKAAIEQLSTKETQIIAGASYSAVEMMANPNKYKALVKIQQVAGFQLAPSNADVAAANPQPTAPTAASTGLPAGWTVTAH